MNDEVSGREEGERERKREERRAIGREGRGDVDMLKTEGYSIVDNDMEKEKRGQTRKETCERFKRSERNAT